MSAVLLRQSDGSRRALYGVTEAMVGLAYTVTDHEVEVTGPGDLATVSDHVRRQPREVRLTAIVSETPPDGDEYGPAHVQAVLDWLESSAGEPLTVILPHRPTYRDLVIAELPYLQAVAEGVELRLTLREVRQATAETVQVPALARTGLGGRSPQADAGVVATEPVGAAQQRSTLRDVVGAAGQILGIGGGP